jgi:hypothetical protein
MSHTGDVKAELTQSLRYLHLPTVRQCYEEVARQAERESLSYERYLHKLVQRECEERQENRITKMLRESQLPLEKSLEGFDTKRLPAKAARQMRSLLDGQLSGENGQCPRFWKSWERENAHAGSDWPGTGAARPPHALHQLRNARPGTSDR